MTTLADVLAAHRWFASRDGEAGCICSYGDGVDMTLEQWNVHFIEAVAAAGLQVVQLPEPAENGFWYTGYGQYSTFRGRVMTPDGSLSVEEARQDAGVLLAVAAAAEAVTSA